MFQELGAGRLASGEALQLGVVETPDAAWAPRLSSLLGHKGEGYRFHIDAALRGPLDSLETLFYVGLVRDEPVTVSMLAGAHGAGVYGHVFTVPEWRRRGASTLQHAAVSADARGRGYRALTLGTNPEGHARRIYERIGFRAVRPGSGEMMWRADGDEWAAGPAAVGPVRWDDWGWISVAGCQPADPGEERPRSVLFDVREAGHVEGRFIAAMRAGRPLMVLRAGCAAVGWAALADAPAAALGALAIDLHVRRGFRHEADLLLSAVPWPERPVVCAFGGPPGYRAQALGRFGFRKAADLPDWWDLGRGGPEAASLWVRWPGSGT